MPLLSERQQLDTLLWAMRAKMQFIAINLNGQIIVSKVMVGSGTLQLTKMFSGAIESQIEELHAMMVAERLEESTEEFGTMTIEPRETYEASWTPADRNRMNR